MSNDTLIEGNQTSSESQEAPAEHLDPFVPQGFAADVAIEPEYGEEPGAEQQEVIPQEEEEPHDSAKYFQSKYDQAQAQNRQMQQQMQYLAQQVQQLSSGQPQVNPQAAQALTNGTSADSVKRPTRPQKPAGYDPMDAAMDPASASWAYRESMDQFNEDVLHYMENIQEAQMRQAEERAEREAYQSRVSAWEEQLGTTYQMPPEERKEFMTIMDDPALLTLPNLVKFYKVIKGQSVQPQQRSQQAQRAVSQLPLPPVPAPPSAGPPRAAKSDSDKVWEGIMAAQDVDPWT